jgi:hypothetical protein
MKPALFVIVAVWLGLGWAAPAIQAADSRANPRVDVVLWFDTEDYLLPASDDAAKRVAEMLSERGIRATFKVVGEKARVLEKRGRQDVIAALKKHDIGYHSNFHSVHPTPSEYLADSGLLDGVAEFVRREGGGAADVRRVFGVPTLSCYGQPGSSWAAQTIVGLRQIGVAPAGIPCYVDEGDHVGLDEKPFWYGGALVVYHMGRNYTRMDLHDVNAVAPAKQKVSEIAGRLAKEGGGLISIFYHPCEWVHQQFWDGVNFARGNNPPREEWKPPAQRTPEETEGAFRRFGEYIDHIRSIEGLRFVTASDLPSIYTDGSHTTAVAKEDLREVCRRILQSRAANFQLVQNRSYSAADQFEMLTRFVFEAGQKRGDSSGIQLVGLIGPDGPAPQTAVTNRKVSSSAFRDAVSDVHGFIEAHHRVPSRIFIGPEAISPADFMIGLASVCEALLANGQIRGSEEVVLGTGVPLIPAEKVAKDTPGLFGGWVIHREGFRAPKILDVARQQAWTLKPAVRVH